MSDRLSYEVAVVGGGPAGMTAALYTTRLGHRTAVFEKEGGRHAGVNDVHNLLGVSEDVSGRELAKHAVDQFREYGGTYYLDPVEDVSRTGDGADSDGADGADGDDGGDGGDGGDASDDRDDGDVRGGGDASDVSDDGDAGGNRFVVDATRSTVEADRVVLATGFSDVDPAVPDLRRFTGRGLHYCLHCDAYVLGDGSVFVLGHDDHAATVAMILLNFTDDVDLLLDGEEPAWSDETERQLRIHPVDRVDGEVVGAFARAGRGERLDGDRADESGSDRRDDTDPDSGGEGPWLGGLTFADGTDREYLGGFAMYGKTYNTALAESLGCDLADDGAVAVDERYETSVDGVYAVGDVTHGQNQTVVALGDGAKAGLALHKDLRRFPRPVDDLEEIQPSAVPAASADLRSRMRLLRGRKRHAGLRWPTPDH